MEPPDLILDDLGLHCLLRQDFYKKTLSTVLFSSLKLLF